MPNRYTERKSGTAGMQVLPTAVPERYDESDGQRKFRDASGAVRAYVTTDQPQTLSNKTLASPRFTGRARETRTAQSIATDGNVTYTAAQVTAGLIVRSGLTAARTDAFPAAADLVAALGNPAVGDSFTVVVLNDSAAANNLTVNGASTGVTYKGTAALAQGEAGVFIVVLTDVTADAEAYTVYQVS
jgi:hypothetical protein